MTVSSSSASTTLLGNGADTEFDFNFPAVSASDLEIIYTDTDGAQTTLTSTQYLVALNPIAIGAIWSVGGFVTYPLSGSPIASGTSLTINRIVPLTQPVSISNQGNYSPQVIEAALDNLCYEIQQVAARTGQLRGTWVTDTLYNYSDMVVDGVNGDNTGNIYSCNTQNTSDVWSDDLAAGDWSLALNVQAIVNSLPSIANNQVFANISGMVATPTGVGVSALIDSAIGNTQGSILYRSGAAWVALTPGTNGQLLSTQGAAANPQWVTASGAGTITQVTAGTGLSGGGASGSVTLNFASIADKSILANLTGSSNPASATTLSAILDNVLGSTQGSVIYRSGSIWTVLGPGTSGQTLQTQGAAANPQWANVNNSVKAWARFNGASTGTNPPTEGLNVASITRNGTGDYTVTFTSLLSTANYAITLSGSSSYGTGNTICLPFEGPAGSESVPTTASFRFCTSATNVGAFDPKYVSVMVMGT